MPIHCVDCDKPIAGESGFKTLCSDCKKKESTKERKMDIHSIYNIYIYIYNIKYMLNNTMSRIIWHNH